MAEALVECLIQKVQVTQSTCIHNVMQTKQTEQFFSGTRC